MKTSLNQAIHLLSEQANLFNTLSSNFYIAECNFGKGLFAKNLIKTGEEILRFKGPYIDFEQTLAKGNKQGDALQIGNNLYIDVEEPGRFVNHSCNPNAGIQDNTVLIALQDIPKGEEIYFDYSTTMDEDHWTMPCKCGDENCRESIKDFRHLPSHLKQKYLDLKIVQECIAIQYQQTVAVKI